MSVIRRTILVALILLVPVALASSSTWTDAAGDVQMRLAAQQPLPPGVTCSDDRVDITSVAATSSEEWITFEVTFVNLAHEPECVFDATGTSVAMSAGRQDLALVFGSWGGNPGLFLDAYGLKSCDAEFWIGDHFGQPSCDVEISDNTVTVRVPTFTWAIDERTGENVENFDLRTLEWPAGRAVSWATDRFEPTSATMRAWDELDLGVYAP